MNQESPKRIIYPSPEMPNPLAKESPKEVSEPFVSDCHGARIQGWTGSPRCEACGKICKIAPEKKGVGSKILYMKLTIGGQNKEKYFTKLKKADIKVSDWSKDLINKTEFQKKKKTIEIEIVSGKDLGFTDWTTREKIYEKAQELGYGILPAEAGIAFRLEYKDQPLYEWVAVGMEPIADSDGVLRVFNVELHDDGRWLLSDFGHPDRMWRPDYRWVFARRKYPKT